MAQEDPNALFMGYVGQKVVVMKDGKVLMCKGNTGFLEHLWDFPGGRMHTGEFPAESLARELKEELGVEFTLGKPLFTAVTYKTPKNIPRYYVVFEASLVDPDAPFQVAEDEIAELRWVGEDEVNNLPTWEDWRVLLKEYFKQHAR